MSWKAHYFDPRLNRDAVTRAFGSKDDALLAACDLIRRKCIVRFVHGPDSEKIDAVAVIAWCKGHPTRDHPAPPKQIGCDRELWNPRDARGRLVALHYIEAKSVENNRIFVAPLLMRHIRPLLMQAARNLSAWMLFRGPKRLGG